MNIYVYSDESGVFDRKHNDYYVYGGLIILGKESRDDWIRKYASIETQIRAIEKKPSSYEIKSTTVSIKSKYKIFKSLNNCYKFGCVIDQNKVHNNIWNSKKDKQRYLDYAYKIAIKRAFEDLIKKGYIIPDDVERLCFDIDEHTTATNGQYELSEGLEQEFKRGTYNFRYMTYYPPIFLNLLDCQVKFSNSSAPNKKLVRASDFVANKIYHYALKGEWDKLNSLPNLHVIRQP